MLGVQSLGFRVWDVEGPDRVGKKELDVVMDLLTHDVQAPCCRMSYWALRLSAGHTVEDLGVN